MNKGIVLVVAAFAIAGCAKKPEEIAQAREAAGEDIQVHTITCYSGGVEIYKGQTRGYLRYWSVPSTSTSFYDVDTKKTVTIIGDCVVVKE